MNKIEALIEQYCPEGVAFRELGNVGKFIRGNGLQKKDFVESGVGCIHYGQVYTYYGIFTYSTKSFVSPELARKLKKAQKGDLIIAATSENLEDVCKAVTWLGEEEIAVSGDAYIFRHSQNAKYIAYFFKTKSFFDNKRKYATGTKVIRVSGESMAKILVPIPPLPVQEEIVNILDKFTSLEAELEAELEARKTQYEFYRNQLLNFEGKEMEWKNLGEIGRVCMCKRVMKNETTAIGEIPFYKIGTFGGHPDAYISLSLYENYRTNFSFPKKGDILISASGTIGRTVIYDGTPAYFQDSNIVWVDNNEKVVSNKFLFHFYKIVKWKTDGGTISRLYNDNLSKTRIPIPPISEQERIVAILDKFDALVNDISEGLPAEILARRKQYEYYRNKLLTFKPLAN